MYTLQYVCVCVSPYTRFLEAKKKDMSDWHSDQSETFVFWTSKNSEKSFLLSDVVCDTPQFWYRSLLYTSNPES